MAGQSNVLVIRVSPDRIARGKPQCREGCAVALATKEEIEAVHGPMERVCVTPGWINVDGGDFGGGYYKCYKLPGPAWKPMGRFDRGLDIEPFEFRLDLDAPVAVGERMP